MTDFRSVYLVVSPGFELLDLSGPLCALHLANSKVETPYVIKTVSARGGAITSTAGVEIHTSKAPPDKFLGTVLVVGGPFSPGIEADDETVVLVKELAPRATRITSVCTGAFVLATAGLLDGRVATTHWRFAPDLNKRFPRVRVDSDRIYVKDGNVWTSAGITASIDLALALIEDDFGVDVAKAVARDMVVYHRRPGGQSQFSTLLELDPSSDRVKDAMQYAREHLREPLTVKRMAEAARISARQFARLFVQETGETPARAVERLRAELAVSRVQEGIEPIEIIARDVGFGDKERMRRAFVRIYGQSPQAMRRVARSRLAS